MTSMWEQLALQITRQNDNVEIGSLGRAQYYHTRDPIRYLESVGMWSVPIHHPGIEFRYKQQLRVIQNPSRSWDTFHPYYLVSQRETTSIVCTEAGKLDLCEGSKRIMAPLLYHVKVVGVNEPMHMHWRDTAELSPLQINAKSRFVVDDNMGLCVDVTNCTSKPYKIANQFFLKPWIAFGRITRIVLCGPFEVGKTYSVQLRSYNFLDMESQSIMFV